MGVLIWQFVELTNKLQHLEHHRLCSKLFAGISQCLRFARNCLTMVRLKSSSCGKASSTNDMLWLTSRLICYVLISKGLICKNLFHKILVTKS